MGQGLREDWRHRDGTGQDEKGEVMQLIAYLASILGVLAIGVGAITYLECARPDGFNSQVSYAVIGLCTMVLTQLLSTIKSINNGKAIEEVKTKLEK